MRNLIFFTLSLIAMLTSASAQESRSEYTIKEPEPRTGSLISRNLVSGSPIAINKRYHELSAEEKARLNSYYDHVEPGDEPPFPEKGLSPMYAALSKAQAKLLVTGELFVVAAIDANGDASQARVLRSPDPEMSKFSASLLLLTKFKPALCGGNPCKMDYPLFFNFTVRH